MIIESGTYDDFKLNVFNGWQETVDDLLVDFAKASKFSITSITYMDALVTRDIAEVTVVLMAPPGMTKHHANSRIRAYALRKPVPVKVDLLVNIQDGDSRPYTIVSVLEKSAAWIGPYAGTR